MVEGQEPWVFDGSPSADGGRKQGKAVCKASSVIKEETCPSNWLGKDQAEIQTPDQGSQPSPCPLVSHCKALAGNADFFILQ